MASEVKICNTSLSHLGAYLINSLSDASQEARQCSLLYDDARDKALRDFPWAFAEKVAPLGLLSSVSPTRHDYAYQYPSDCVNARLIYDETDSDDPIPFRVVVKSDLSSKMIITDEAEAILIYTARVTDPNLFDPSFTSTLSWRLAADLAIPLTKNQTLADSMEKRYIAAIAAAQRSDTKESIKKEERFNTFLTARS
jgi:hypothetical protein